MDAHQLKEMLNRQAEAVAEMLLPNGKRVGRDWVVGDVSGASGKSCKVCVKGARVGVWKDFGDSEKGGDLIELWARTKNLSYSDTFDEIRDFLGVEKTGSPFQVQVKRNYKRPPKPKCRAPEGEGLAWLRERGFTDETIKAFRVGCDQKNVYFPFLRDGELIMCKFRKIRTKDMMPTTADQEKILFGWQAVGDERHITICEGEFDAMALREYGITALSVPFGGGGGEKQDWISNEWDKLQKFDVIYICMDADKMGREGAAEIVERLGRHRCKVVTLPDKDANDCLMSGVPQTMIQRCFDTAVHLDPAELRQASDYAQDVINEFYPENLPEQPGFYGPWQHTHEKFKFAMSELSVFNGINGHGKSQVVGHLCCEAIREGEKVCIASMELKPRKLLKRLTSQVAGLIDGRPSEDYINAIMEWYQDRLFIFDVIGQTKQNKIFEVFEYAHRRHGVRVFVIDSLLMCGIDEDDNNGQKAFVQRCCDFKNQFDCHLMLVTHSRKLEHENKMIGKFDVRGSGAITDLADLVFMVWRNKQKEIGIAEETDDELLEKLKSMPDAILMLCKNRNGDWEGKVNCWFQRNCFQYLSGPDQKPFQYVQYSQQSRLTA